MGCCGNITGQFQGYTVIPPSRPARNISIPHKFITTNLWNLGRLSSSNISQKHNFQEVCLLQRQHEEQNKSLLLSKQYESDGPRLSRRNKTEQVNKAKGFFLGNNGENICFSLEFIYTAILHAVHI